MLIQHEKNIPLCITGVNYILKYITSENILILICYNILQYYCFYCFFD